MKKWASTRLSQEKAEVRACSRFSKSSRCSFGKLGGTVPDDRRVTHSQAEVSERVACDCQAS